MPKKSISKYGFKRDSPYKNKSKLVIQSNVIDMNDTDFPLLLVPDNDEPILAPAQSGGYFFPNSNSVTEYRLDKLPKFNRGGKLKSSQQDLVDWTNQNWKTKSGKPSHETGERYLPEDAIKALSDAEYQRTSQKKRSDGGVGNVSKQPDNIADKVRKYRMRDGGSTVNAAGNYTKPDMRKQLFEEIKKSNVMGTPSGKWSARKAQLLAKRYKEQGGGYKQMGGIVETPDGFYIDELELMNQGGPTANPIPNDLTTQRYADLYNEGRVHTYDPYTDTYNASTLPEVEIKGASPKSLKDFARRYNKKISDEYKESLAKSLFVAPVMAATEAPKAMMSYYVSDDSKKSLEPAEVLNIENPYGAVLINNLLDPTNVTPAGVANRIKTINKLLTSKNLIKNLLPKKPTLPKNIKDGVKQINPLDKAPLFVELANAETDKPLKYRFGGKTNYSIEETPGGYFINETSN